MSPFGSNPLGDGGDYGVRVEHEPIGPHERAVGGTISQEGDFTLDRGAIDTPHLRGGADG
jgi:hypothetical protein